MTIKSDKSKVTLDFECEIQDQKYSIRFHYTELGQTISICEDNDAYTGYPAQLFSEIVDFLRSQNVIGNDSEMVPQVSRSVLPTVQPLNSVAPLPVTHINLDSDIKESGDFSNTDNEPQRKVIMDVEPVQSFSDGQSSSKIPTQVKSSTPVDKSSAIEDANDPDMLSQRQAAVAKAKNKSIKPIDREDS